MRGTPPGATPGRASAPAWRDLNGNGVMDPYEDPDQPVDVRVEDLLGRLSLEEKAGLMFHTVIEAGPDGDLLDGAGKISKTATADVVLGKHLSHFNVHALDDARQAARWSNNLQRLAEQTPHGIPVTVSTDPRHAFIENAGVSFAAGSFSQWPEPLGLAALRDVEAVRRFADVVRREYLAVGIREALHPTLDLATEPRWARQAGTFGQDPDLVGDLTVAYLEGLQGTPLGPEGVACVSKHFPGGGPQQDGEDAHFPYGREQVYPGGRFADHLAPFPRAVAAGTAAVMPYYGMPVDLVVDGEAIDAVGFAYNWQVVTGMLRERLGFDGVVLTDWELVNDNHIGDQVLPARAWGVEHLDRLGRMELLLAAGCDQFGGEECVDLLLELVRSGRIEEARVDDSVRRLLRVKFQLGLFDDPYVDEEAAMDVVGCDEHRRAGLEAQSRSVTVLRNEDADSEPVLPLPAGAAVYAEGVDDDALVAAGLVPVATPEEADLALVRIGAPFDPRDDLFLEAWFHQGSLEFPPGLVSRLQRVASHCPLVLDVTLDRPAVLTPLAPVCAALTATYGTSGRALLDSLTGACPPAGRLPFDVPVSMEAVRRHPEDVPGFGDDALFRFGDGLEIPVRDPG